MLTSKDQDSDNVNFFINLTRNYVLYSIDIKGDWVFIGGLILSLSDNRSEVVS